MIENYIPKNGDRVRVVLEGPVTDARATAFAVGSGPRRNMIYPDTEHVISIEKLARVWKVGDVISGDDYTDEGIPLGTVAVEKSNKSTAIKLTESEWAEVRAGYTTIYSSNTFDHPRTIVYAPDAFSEPNPDLIKL